MIKFISKLLHKITKQKRESTPQVIKSALVQSEPVKVKFDVEIVVEPQSAESILKEEAHLRKAFEQICGDVVFYGITQDEVYNIIYEYRHHGSSRMSYKLREKGLITIQWNWFDEWLNKFQSISQYPNMWKDWFVGFSAYPKDLETAVKRLTVKNMKSILMRCGYNEFPKLRQDLEIFFKQRISYEELQPELKERMKEKGWDENDEYRNLKIDLLCHSVVRRSYAIRDSEFYSEEYLNELSETFISKPSLDFSDDVEKYAVNKFLEPIKNGKVMSIPPFFPGSMGRVRYIQRKKR